MDDDGSSTAVERASVLVSMFQDGNAALGIVMEVAGMLDRVTAEGSDGEEEIASSLMRLWENHPDESDAIVRMHDLASAYAKLMHALWKLDAGPFAALSAKQIWETVPYVKARLYDEAMLLDVRVARKVLAGEK